jgi:hypothetical protein
VTQYVYDNNSATAARADLAHTIRLIFAGTGAADAVGETFEQLDELLVTLGASAGRS